MKVEPLARELAELAVDEVERRADLTEFELRRLEGQMEAEFARRIRSAIDHE